MDNDPARVYQAWAKSWVGIRFFRWKIGFWRDCTGLYTRPTIFHTLQLMIDLLQHLRHTDARIKVVEYDTKSGTAKLLRELTLEEAQHALSLTDAQLELLFYPWEVREPEMAESTSGVF